MLYVPTATLTTPVVVQDTQIVPFLTTTSRYYTVPTVPLLSTALVYPTYTLQTKLIEKPQPTQVKESVQHVIHHYPSSYRVNCCCDCCDSCCCTKNYETSERKSRSRTPPPPRYPYDGAKSNPYVETIDEKIERIRRELKLNSASKRDKSTETIDYYRRPITPPPVTTPQRVPYKIHYDAPKPRRRSSSSHRSPSLPREPWRPTNQNDYPWRDAHLPAYRDATLNRSKTPDTQYQTRSSPCNDKYIYRPKSETEARKYYTESTGKNPDVEVYNSLRSSISAYDCKNSCYNTPENRQTLHSFYSNVSISSAPKVVDLTTSLKGADACIHIVPKNASKLDPPYLKIYNSPVTYLH